MEELVRRSYQYVAMFNVNNKFALDPDNPMTTGGYNRTLANTELADHTLQAIARPNNDTLYTIALIDVTEEPVVLEMPAFDSTYVSLGHGLRPLREHPDVDHQGRFLRAGYHAVLQRTHTRL